MDFKTATDELAGVVTHAEIAEAAGVSVQTIRQARLAPDHANYRPPPTEWRRVLAVLAEQKSERLKRLAGRIRSS